MRGTRLVLLAMLMLLSLGFPRLLRNTTALARSAAAPSTVAGSVTVTNQLENGPQLVDTGF